MKEIKKEDIQLVKLVCLNMKKTILKKAELKDVDTANNSIVNIFNFEQRMIDLIEEKLKGQVMCKTAKEIEELPNESDTKHQMG